MNLDAPADMERLPDAVELALLRVLQEAVASVHMLREAVIAGARGYIVKSDAARHLLPSVEAVTQHKFFTAQHRELDGDSK